MKQVFTPQFEGFRDRILDKASQNPFLQYTGFRIEKIDVAEVVLSLMPEAHHFQQTGFIHGGLTATAADIATGLAAYTLIGSNEHVVTADLNVSYLNPGTKGILVARGFVIKAGRMLHFCEGEVLMRDGNDEVLIAKATSTMAVIRESDLRK